MTDDIQQLKELKAALRREARGLRKTLAPAWRAAASAAICAGILALPELQSPAARSVAAFFSFGDEIDTRPLLEELIARTGSVLLPRVVPGERRLEFRRAASLDTGFAPAYQGILEPDPAAWPEVVEPAAMDLIVVPGLIFDRRGYRIGYGGGFYDRVLTQPRRCRTVGIIFSPLLRAEPLPATAWDKPVDAMMTEEGLIQPEAR